MSEHRDQMSRQLDQVYRRLAQILAAHARDERQLGREIQRVMEEMKIAQKMAEADEARKEIEEKLDNAKSAWAAAIISFCAAISVTESEEEMARLEAKLDNLAGVLSEVSTDIQSILSHAREFEP